MRRTRGSARPARSDQRHPFAGCHLEVQFAELALYDAYLGRSPDLVDLIAQRFAGRDVACWCPLDRPCHGDRILQIARDGRLEP